jgi:hypothetical protein
MYVIDVAGRLDDDIPAAEEQIYLLFLLLGLYR